MGKSQQKPEEGKEDVVLKVEATPQHFSVVQRWNTHRQKEQELT